MGVTRKRVEQLGVGGTARIMIGARPTDVLDPGEAPRNLLEVMKTNT